MSACVQSSDFVLIVDDTPTNISVLAQTLRQDGLSIRIANDGYSALSQVRREAPSLILLDVQMPGIDGFETCRQLKADQATCQIPVIFMTALTDKKSRVEGLSIGAVDYIAKPFEQAEVLARVRIHLQLKQMSDQLAMQVEDKTRSLQHTRAQLVEQEKLATLGQLMAGVAHEINNPMSCIANNIDPARAYVQDLSELIDFYKDNSSPTPIVNQEIEEFWEERDIDFALEDLPKLLNSMQLSIERIKDLSTSLRCFGRGESSDKVLFDIEKGIDSTLVILGHRLRADSNRSKIAIVKQYGQVSTIHCFPSAINQVLMNLLANAIDAVEESARPTITITTQRVDDRWVEIEIIDNGSGIEDKVRSRLFEPLFTTKPMGKGTGLGLSISHKIVVEKHQGEIACSSTLGEGSRFVVRLPLL